MFEQMKGLTPKKKIEYYIQYYGLVTAIVIAAIIFVIYFAVSVATEKDDVAGIIVLNNNSDVYETNDGSELDEYLNNLLAKYQFDAKDYEITTEAGYYIGDGVDSTTAYATTTKLQTVLMAKAVDIVFFDDRYDDELVAMGAFCDITEMLPEGYDTSDTSKFLYYTDEETGETFPAAVRVSPSSKFLKMAGWYTEDSTIYMGICFNRLCEDDTLYETILADCLEE